MNKIGSTIRRLRLERSLTQEELAEHLGITSQAISKWENGIGMPDISQVVPLAHFFGVTTDMLFGLASENIHNEIESIIETATAKDSYLEEYEMLQEALKTYPGDTRLLLELLSCGYCLLSDGDMVTGTERTKMFEECERAGKLILSSAKDIKYLMHWRVEPIRF